MIFKQKTYLCTLYTKNDIMLFKKISDKINKQIYVMRTLTTLSIFCFSTFLSFADYASRGRPWDAYDNYDSSRGFWLILFLLGIGVIVFIGAIAKYTWENHKDSIKDFFGIVIFLGVIILLFLLGKSCSEANHHESHSTYPIQQNPQPVNNNVIQEHNNLNYQQTPSTVHYRTEFYNETCPDCGGLGAKECSFCKGYGYVKTICPSCHGEGFVIVNKAIPYFGPQEVGDVKYEWEQVKESCGRCLGKGYIKEKCTHCDNDFPFPTGRSSYVTCPTCKGQGTIQKSRQVEYYE